MPFIKDPENSGRFDNVLAPKKRLRMLIHRAKQMRKPAAARYFLSRFCGLVCSKEELAAANGLGLRGGKGLDNCKVDAIFGKFSKVTKFNFIIFPSAYCVEFLSTSCLRM